MTRRDYQRDYRQSYKDHAKRVNLTLSLPEYRRVVKLASWSGVPAATYLKRIAFAALESRPELPDELAAQLADLDRILRTVANNVNQMARYSHCVWELLDERELFQQIAALRTQYIATITRKEPSFSQLVGYIDRGASAAGAWRIRHNLLARNLWAIRDEFAGNGDLLQRRKNGVYLYHEIISITRAKGVSLERQKMALREIAERYIAERCPDNLVFGNLHEDQEHSLHYHLIISANRMPEIIEGIAFKDGIKQLNQAAWSHRHQLLGIAHPVRVGSPNPDICHHAAIR